MGGMSEFDRLAARVAKWTDKNQAGSNATGLLFKLLEEAGELAGAYVKEKPRYEEAGEIADVLICLLIYARARGIDPVAASHEKMMVNESRVGRTNSFGIFVKAADLL